VINIWVGIGVVVTTVAELCFVARFLRLPWWKSPEGRMFMAKDSVILLVLALALIANFWPDMPCRDHLRVVVWTLIPIVFVWKTVLFYRRQAEGRRLRLLKRNQDHEVSP
jgi:hypothetical protein